MFMIYIAAAVVIIAYGGVLINLLFNACIHAAGMLFVPGYRADVRRRRRLERRARELERRARRRR